MAHVPLSVRYQICYPVTLLFWSAAEGGNDDDDDDGDSGIIKLVRLLLPPLPLWPIGSEILPTSMGDVVVFFEGGVTVIYGFCCQI